MWVMMVKEAEAKVSDSDPYYANKLVTAKYFFERVLPESSLHLAKVKAGADTVMALPAEAF